MEQINTTIDVQQPMEDQSMQQGKNSLWILFAAGIFLCVVIGAALILYRPSVKDPVISSVNLQQPQPQASDTWMNPAVTSIETNMLNSSDLSAENSMISPTETVVDLNNLGTANDLTTVRDDTNITVVTTTEPVEAKVSNVSKPVVTETKEPVVQKKPAQTAAAATSKKAQTVTEYWIQTGSFSSREYAENAQDIISSYKIDSEIFTKEINGKTWYRVRMGPYRTKTEADYWKTAISSDDVNFKDAYITEVKTQK